MSSTAEWKIAIARSLRTQVAAPDRRTKPSSFGSTAGHNNLQRYGAGEILLPTIKTNESATL